VVFFAKKLLQNTKYFAIYTLQNRENRVQYIGIEFYTFEVFMATPRYKRILLKLSGEALTAPGKGILDFDFIAKVADVLKRCRAEGVEIGVIVGAGNIWRGRQGGKA
jgi:hypothetical protein